MHKRPKYKPGDIIEHWDFYDRKCSITYLVILKLESVRRPTFGRPSKQIKQYQLWSTATNKGIWLDVDEVDMSSAWGYYERHCPEAFTKMSKKELDKSNKTE